VGDPAENFWGRYLDPSETIRLSLDLEKALTEEEKMEILVEMLFGFNRGLVPKRQEEALENASPQGNP